jgi:hypothetical protein
MSVATTMMLLVEEDEEEEEDDDDRRRPLRMSAGCRHPAPKPVDELLCGSDVIRFMIRPRVQG